MDSVIQLVTYFSIFYGCDVLLSFTSLQGIYYLIHTIHNGFIVYHTYNDVILSFTDFPKASSYPVNIDAASLVFALHFYHIARYRYKLTFEDWLHHITMIFVALPIAVFLQGGLFLGFSLFFTTGLPGGIDYFMLFLVRNGWLNRMTEKRLNRWIQVWIRSPGCVGQALLSIAHIFSYPSDFWMRVFGTLSSGLVFWNGQYFMNRVVANYAIESNNAGYPKLL
jgi:hypothetical protein